MILRFTPEALINILRLKMEQTPSQRDRERERRRIRDRERRSSMTTEQRETHLARRRRNYQMRRLRSRNETTTNPQPSFSSPAEMAETNSPPAETSIAELDLQRNGLTLIGFNHEHDALNPDSTRSSGSETLDPAILEGRVRLSQIRRVARSIIHSSSHQIGIHQIFSQLDSAEESTCKCNSLRLNRVKHLARMMNSSANASADPQQ